MPTLSTKQASKYRPQLRRAIQFVVDNRERSVHTAEIAKAAGFSEYHFHRIFLAVMGETVGQFVTRYRLECAARMIAYEGDLSITEIGLACGYSSSANFSKAFSSFFGFSPSALRSPRPDSQQKLGSLKQRYEKEVSPEDFYTLPEPEHLQGRLERVRGLLRFETRGVTPLVCISGPGGYEIPPAMALWEQFATRVGELGLWGPETEMFGVLHDDPVITAENICRYDACISAPGEGFQVPSPLFGSELPEGRYAVFAYDGPIDQLDELYRDIYSLWFPQSGLAPGGHPPVERYLSRGPDPSGRVQLDILFKLRQAREI